MVRYYAEFEWKDPSIMRSLPSDGHQTKDFIPCNLTEDQLDWDAFCHFVHLEYVGFRQGKVYLMIVYTENEDGSHRTIYEHKA